MEAGSSSSEELSSTSARPAMPRDRRASREAIMKRKKVSKSRT